MVRTVPQAQKDSRILHDAPQGNNPLTLPLIQPTHFCICLPLFTLLLLVLCFSFSSTVCSACSQPYCCSNLSRPCNRLTNMLPVHVFASVDCCSPRTASTGSAWQRLQPPLTGFLSLHCTVVALASQASCSMSFSFCSKTCLDLLYCP